MPLPKLPLTLCLAGALWLGPGVLSAAAPDWAVGQPIYEVNPEMFAATDAFMAVEKDLPRIKDLGVGIVWLMPVHPRGLLKAFNSPYCVRDFTGIHAAYGSEADLKSLVRTAHRLGMHVILDWVGNHSSWDHPWVREHPDWYVHGPSGGIAPVKGYTDIVQFDYAQPGLREAMIRAMLHWVKDCGVDGFRCDMAWNIPLDFWQQARARLEAVRPVFLLAEENSPRTLGAFDADYDWNLMPPSPECDLMRIAQGRIPPTAIDAALEKEVAYAVPPDFYRLRYTSNHDEFNDVGTPQQTLGAAHKALAVLMATLPGKPLVYNGQELGWEGRGAGAKTGWNTPPDPRLDFSASTRSAWYGGFYRRLLHLDQALPQERNEVLTRLSPRGDCHIYAFLRRAGRDRLLVLLNLSADRAPFALEGEGLEGSYTDLFSGQAVQVPASLTGTAAPWEYRVLVAGEGTAGLLKALNTDGPLAPGWADDPSAPLAGPCPTPVAYPTPSSERVPYLAACASEPAEAGWQPLDRLVMGTNPDGVAARFRTTWDSQALQVSVEVEDAAAFNNLPSPWEDSSVELYLNLGHGHAGAYGAGDFQYIFTFGRPEPFEQSGRTAGVACASSRTAQSWSVRASIPWTTLGVTPTPQAPYGFDLGVDFNQDGSGRQGQLLWHGGPDDYRDTSLFSDLLLQACPGAAAP